jgi:thiol peroxidase
VVSDVLETDMGEKYGLLVRERRTLRRAVFVVDRAGTVTYAAYMQHNGLEPDYDEVIEAAKAAL